MHTKLAPAARVELASCFDLSVPGRAGPGVETQRRRLVLPGGWGCRRHHQARSPRSESNPSAPPSKRPQLLRLRCRRRATTSWRLLPRPASCAPRRCVRAVPTHGAVAVHRRQARQAGYHNGIESTARFPSKPSITYCVPSC